MNPIDRIIRAVSPEKALKREVARKRLSMVNSGYGNYGGNSVKKSVIGWTHGGGSHREDIEDNIDPLRQRSRDLYYGGSNIATGAVKRLRTNTVGTGLQLKSTINEEILGITADEARKLEETIEREFAHWAKSTNCDLERLDNFYQLQQLALLNALLSGDSFALMKTTKRTGSIYDLRIELIEADRVSTPDKDTINPLFCEGVEKDEAGEVVAYHISKFHPLSFADRNPREWVRVEAYGKRTGRKNIIHVMNRERIGQVRGVPFLSPVIETIKQLGRYTEAEVVAAVVSGLIAVFIEKESASNDSAFGEVVPEEKQVDAEDENSIELAPGAVIDLGEGEKANMTTPGRPNSNFDPFVMAVIKQIGAALEIPYEILIMAFTNNYSASRAAILEFFKVIKMYREWFIADFCQPIYEEWLCEAVAKGRVQAPGFFNDPIIKDAYCSAEWNGPSVGQLDPVKEVQAAELRVQGGYSTREKEATELTGTDFYKNVKQRKREEELLKEVTGSAKKGDLTPGILEIRNQTQTPTRKLTNRTERKKPRNKNEINRFWNFVASEEGSTAELLLYGEISEYSWYEDDITPKEFNKDLKAMGEVEEITVRINSGGGDVFAAVAIYTRLKEHKAHIAVKIDGWCASAATIIAMAGDSIEISVGGIFMIHDPAAGILGYYKADELKKIADELETIKQSIVNCYMTVTDKSEDEIKSLMTDETWFTGEEAVEAGFCTAVMLTEVETEVEDAEKVIVNSVPINLSTFHTVPKGLLGYANSHNNKPNVKNNKEDETMTLEEFKTKHPEVADAYKNEIMATAKTGETDSTAAVDAERARIKAIDEITLPGFEDLANKAKYETPVSAEAFAMQIVAAQKKTGQKFLNDREADLNDSGVNEVNPVSNKGGADDEADPFGKIIDEMYPQAK